MTADELRALLVDWRLVDAQGVTPLGHSVRKALTLLDTPQLWEQLAGAPPAVIIDL